MYGGGWTKMFEVAGFRWELSVLRGFEDQGPQKARFGLQDCTISFVQLLLGVEEVF